VTLIVQLAPGATELPHVLVWAKSPGSAPVNPTLVILSVTVPGLFRVTDCAALLVPTSWVANLRVQGDRVASGHVEVAVPFERGTKPVVRITSEWSPAHGTDTEQMGPGMVAATAQAGKVEHAVANNRETAPTEGELAFT
jgi:hypothetical protein